MKTFIIDDDHISMFLTQHLLKATGFPGEITTFLSAEEALQHFPANVPQILFLDLNMPDMNGWEFLTILASYQEQLLLECRIYILTSSLDVADTAKSKENKLVWGLIHKPIDMADIKEIMFQLEKQI